MEFLPPEAIFKEEIQTAELGFFLISIQCSKLTNIACITTSGFETHSLEEQHYNHCIL